MSLFVKTFNTNNKIIFSLSGKFRALDAIKFKQSLLETIEINEYENFIIDLHNVVEIDITALNSLLIANRQLNKLSKSLMVKASKEHEINHLLQLTMFKTYLTINDSIEN